MLRIEVTGTNVEFAFSATLELLLQEEVVNGDTVVVPVVFDVFS
jgi:hypothetical protein